MRITSFIFLLFVSLSISPAVLFAPALLYALLWPAYELLVLAAFIDVYFGVAVAIPYYTIAAATIIVLAEVLKPYIIFYSR